MKCFVVLALLVAAAIAAPASIDNAEVVVLESSSDVRPDGYDYAYKTSDGVSRMESGRVINAGTDDESLAVSGSYKFVEDGEVYEVTYIADENGFQPSGKHLPVA